MKPQKCTRSAGETKQNPVARCLGGENFFLFLGLQDAAATHPHSWLCLGGVPLYLLVVLQMTLYLYLDMEQRIKNPLEIDRRWLAGPKTLSGRLACSREWNRAVPSLSRLRLVTW
jgi:hypothetical protein